MIDKIQYTKVSINFIFSILLISCAEQPLTVPTPDKAPQFSNDMQKSSYAQGVQYVELLQRNEIPIDGELFLLGINDVLNKRTLRLKPEELQRGKDWVYVQQMLYMDRTSKKNVADGEIFLKSNRNKPGVVSLPSGVQYKIIKDSASPKKPGLSDVVSLNYKVANLNGETFFSTEQESKAALIKVGAMIPGWQEAVLKMPVGSKWKLYIPGPLAYGENVAPEGKLKPNEMVIIESELLEIVPPEIARVKLAEQNKPVIKKTSSW